MKTASASGHIVNGELKLYDSNGFKASLKDWKDCEVELTVDYYAPRHTDSQREYYHACVVKNIQAAFIEFTGSYISAADTHEWLKRQYNGKEFVDNQGVVQRIGLSTRKMTKPQMMEYIDKCIQFGTEDLGIPYEQFDNEMYKKAKELVARLGMEIKAPKKVRKNA